MNTSILISKMFYKWFIFVLVLMTYTHAYEMNMIGFSFVMGVGLLFSIFSSLPYKEEKDKKPEKQVNIKNNEGNIKM